jgi:hypothetical protein
MPSLDDFPRRMLPLNIFSRRTLPKNFINWHDGSNTRKAGLKASLPGRQYPGRSPGSIFMAAIQEKVEPKVVLNIKPNGKDACEFGEAESGLP